MTIKQTLPLLFFLAFSCGPGSETNNGTTNNGTANNGTTNNGTTTDQELVIRSTIAFDETDTAIMATALNADGSEVAVATRNLRTYEERVRIYSTADGSELREMNDLTLPDNPDEGIAVSIESLFWSESNKLTALQTYRHRFIWDAASGNLLEKKAASEVTDKCAGPRGGVFHPKFNEAFVTTQAVPADNTLCKINLDTNTSEVFTLTEGPVVENFVLDTTGEKLWVNFSDPTDANAFSKEIVNTVAYDARTLAPLADSLRPDGNLILVGDGFYMDRALNQTSLVPGGDFIATTNLAASPGGEVVSTIYLDKEIQFIAIPTGTLIGTVPRDRWLLRSYSGDANVAVTVANGADYVVTILEIGTRTSESVFVEPEIPSGTLTGTVTIEGTEEPLSGNCELITDPDLGPIQFLALGTTGSGWDIRARSQNLLFNNLYSFKKEGETYANTTAIAQNLMIDGPTSTSTDDRIEGQGTLFAFEKYELFERVVDAAHPSGFKAIDFVFNGICTP